MSDLQSIAQSIIEKWSKSGYNSLTPNEKVFFTVWAYAGDVDNGGLEGFFCNPTGENSADTYSSLLAIGADQHASILKRAMDVFHGEIPSDVDERTELFEAMSETEADTWDSLQNEFFALGTDDLYARLEKYSSPPA